MLKERYQKLPSQLYSSRTLKQWENSLQYPFFRHASRSRLELGDCLQAGCLQGGGEEFEQTGEGYSLSSLLRGAEDGLEDAVNPFSGLQDVWDRSATGISMFISVQMFNIFVLVYIETYENYLRQINKNYTVMMFLSAVDETLVASLPNSIISNAAELEKQ